MNKYIFISILALIYLILTVIDCQSNELAKYKSMYEKELQNVEAYKADNSGLEGKIRQYQMTINDLRASKDTLDRKLVEVVDGLKVKDKQIQYLQYQATTAHRTDTISIKDTIFTKEIFLDTVLQDNWYKLQIGLRYPSGIIVSPTFISEKTIVVNSKKEYNKPPSKVFFIRWFQKKHNVVEVNVEEKSPYIDNKEYKFIKILQQ